ncbi:recombinase family protein [Candidatus Woesearchaeota archaeon]|nr:recombinase family protein [Candidatus Woesearchaeota archaeon]
MKIAIYCRTSKIDQNPENQRIQLEEYAKRMDWKYELFEEKESTRKTRPIKYEIIQKLRYKEFDGILVWKLDRWARSVSEASLEMDEFIKKNIVFISLKDNIDISSANGKFFAQILFAFAELERSIIRERTLAGLERARRQGKILGRPEGSKDKKVRKKGGYYLRYNEK